MLIHRVGLQRRQLSLPNGPKSTELGMREEGVEMLLESWAYPSILTLRTKPNEGMINRCCYISTLVLIPAWVIYRWYCYWYTFCGYIYTPAFSALLLDESEELLASLLLSPEAAQHAGGDGLRAWFLDTAHCHTHVPMSGKLRVNVTGE